MEAFLPEFCNGGNGIKPTKAKQKRDAGVTMAECKPGAPLPYSL